MTAPAAPAADAKVEAPEETRGPHYSPSELKSVLSCPAAHRFRYVDKVKVPRKATLELGTWFDEAVNVYWRHLIEFRVPHPLPDLLSGATRAFEASRERVEDWGQTDPEKALAGGLACLEKYVGIYGQGGAHELAPAKVQPWVEIPAGVVGLRRMIGRADLLTADDLVVDVKFGANALWGGDAEVAGPDKEDALRRNLQLILYGVAFRYTHGRAPQAIRMIRAGWKSRKVQHVDVSVTAAMVRWALQAAQGAATLIESGVSHPNPESTWCGSCEYAQACLQTYGAIGQQGGGTQ